MRAYTPDKQKTVKGETERSQAPAPSAQMITPIAPDSDAQLRVFDEGRNRRRPPPLAKGNILTLTDPAHIEQLLAAGVVG